LPFLPPPDPAVEITIATKGMSKGLAQTDGGQIVVRGELGLGQLFVGGLAKNLADATADGEVQLLAGGRWKVRKIELTLSAAYKTWVDPQSTDSEAAEIGMTASRPFGPVTPRFQLIYSPDDLGSTDYSIYAEGGLAWKLSKTLQISANVGRRKRGNGIEYTAGNVGMAFAMNRNFTAEVRFYDTDQNDAGDNFKHRLVALMRAKF
jgi:hypothetical protein